MAVKVTAWDIAQERANEIVAALQPDDLTAPRYAERNGISLYRAKAILDKLVGEGVLQKEPRMRAGQGGHPVQVYVLKGKE